MLKLDSDCLLCDFAQTYHIVDLQSLPLHTVAVLACGLGDNSRIKRKIAGLKVPLDTLILARIADSVALILWSRCKEGTKKPAMLTDILSGKVLAPSEPNALLFASADDFLSTRNTLLKGCE